MADTDAIAAPRLAPPSSLGSSGGGSAAQEMLDFKAGAAPMGACTIKVTGGPVPLSSDLRAQLEAWRCGMTTQLDIALQALSSQKSAVAPWIVKKHRKESQRALEQLRALNESTGTTLNAIFAQINAAKASLVTREEYLAAHVAPLAESTARDAALHDLRLRNEETEAQLKSILAKTDAHGLGESYAVKKAKGAKPFADLVKIEQVNTNLERLLADLEAERANSAKLGKAKDVLTAKVKELQDKVRGTTEITERELRKLVMEVAKTKEAKDVEVEAVRKEAAEMVATKVREMKNQSARFETMKRTAEQARAGGKDLTRSVDEAGLALAKSNERNEEVEKKLAAARLAKEDTVRELEQLRLEHAMLHSVHVAEHAAAPPAGPGDAPANQRFYNAAAPWPRCAFSARSGHVLHSRACGTCTDTTRLVPLAYHSHKELEAAIAEAGLLLCTSCRVEPGF